MTRRKWLTSQAWEETLTREEEMAASEVVTRIEAVEVVSEEGIAIQADPTKTTTILQGTRLNIRTLRDKSYHTMIFSENNNYTLCKDTFRFILFSIINPQA
jgi:hypothetical protein